MEEERAKRSLDALKEVVEQSKGTVASYLFRKEKDLNLEELLELEQELKRVQKEITDRWSFESIGPSVPPSQ